MPSAVARSQMLSVPCGAGLSGVCTICSAPHPRAPGLRRLLARCSVDTPVSCAQRHARETPRHLGTSDCRYQPPENETPKARGFGGQNATYSPSRARASQRRGACIRGFGLSRTRDGVCGGRPGRAPDRAARGPRPQEAPGHAGRKRRAGAREHAHRHRAGPHCAGSRLPILGLLHARRCFLFFLKKKNWEIQNFSRGVEERGDVAEITFAPNPPRLRPAPPERRLASVASPGP